MAEPAFIFVVGLVVTGLVAGGLVVTYREFHRMGRQLDEMEAHGEPVRRKLDGTPYA